MKRHIVRVLDPMGFFYRAARLPEGREEVENGARAREAEPSASASQDRTSEPLPNPMLTQSAAEVSLVDSELVTGWLAWVVP